MQKHLGFVIVLILAFAAPALAADPYIVTGVQVDVTAASASKARDQAIKDASHKAFDTLAQQIFPGRPAPKISNAALGDMVSDFHVEHEQTTANRYVASFTFRFRQNQVRAAFGAGAIIPTPQELAARQNGGNVTSGDVVEDDSNIDKIVAAESADGSDTAIAAQPVSVNPLPSSALLVEVPAHDSRELNSAMDRFRDISAVQSVEFVSITPDKSILRLSYVGASQGLLDQMQAHNIALRADNGTVPPLYILQP